MAGKRKKLLGRKKIPIYLALISIVMMGLLAVKWGMTSEAEDGTSGYYFCVDNAECKGNQYELKDTVKDIKVKKFLNGTADVNNDQTVGNIEWTLGDDSSQYIQYIPNENDLTTTAITWTGETAKITAIGIPDSDKKLKVNAHFIDDNKSFDLTLDVEVILQIKNIGDLFKKALETDEQNSLFLTTVTNGNDIENKIGKDNSEQLVTRIVNDKIKYSWESENTDIVTVEPDTGLVSAVGAGKTRISVKAGKQNATIDAYVLPKIVKMEGDTEEALKNVGAGKEASDISIHSGDMLATNVTLKSSEKLTDRISWSIQKESDTGEIIADSKGKTSELISLTPGEKGDENITVKAKAGKYVLKVYPVKDYENWNVNTEADESFSVKPTTITLNVYPKFAEKSISMNVGDQFKLLDAVNILPDDIKEFKVSLYEGLDGSGTEKTPNIGKNNDYLSIDSNYLVTAKKETADNEYIQVEITPEPGRMDFENIGGSTPTSFKLYFRIIDAVLLNVTDVSLNVGDTMDLSNALSTIGSLENYYAPEDYEWSSSNDKYVSVDEKGQIAGLQLTNTLPNGCAVITVKLKLPSGITKVSTCNVYVKQTVTKIVLDHSEMELIAGGDTEILTATFDADTENARIHWLSSDEKQTYLQMEQLTDNTVSLKGVAPGAAVITVLNEENMVTAICKVNVVRKINSITIPDEMSVNINRGYVKFDAVINPADASDSSLVWKSSNKAVVDVEDDTGLFRLVSPGTVTISVWYKNDPTVNALCKLTVVAGSDSITIDEKASVEVGQKLTLNSIITPVTAETNTYWYSTNEKIATVDEKTGEITGVSVGTTYIIAVTDEGHTDKCELTVTQKASGIAFPQEEITVAKGSTLALAVLKGKIFSHKIGLFTADLKQIE